MKDPIRKNIDYVKILSQKLQNVPAWRDFAKACNDVIGPEIDNRRKLLEKVRDSTKYRRGDQFSNFTYTPEIGKEAINESTGLVVPIPVDTLIAQAEIKNVINNIAFYNNPNDIDYLDLYFTYNGIPCRWLKPVNAVQERDILLKNSYIMGFDFFNTKLSDEDLKRLYEYIQLYWNESGSDDNFIKFVGFIKNIRLELVALWTESPNGEIPTDPDAEYPYLEEFNSSTMTSVTQGGNNWQTSHVEIQYDLAQFQKFYALNLDDLEQLFYYFAPIILVLERVTGKLTVETPVQGVGAISLTSFNYDTLKPATTINTTIAFLSCISTTTYRHGTLNNKRKGCLGMDTIIDLRSKCFDYLPYLASTGII